jgi:phage baseplate assembly protein W
MELDRDAAGFLGTGWSFPFKIEAGVVSLARYEESIRQSVWIVLGTSQGERVMNPEFGCGIDKFVFQPYSAAMRGLILYEVGRALRACEPRITSVNVQVRNTGVAGEVVEIDIDYVVIATNSRQSLVYPFYLERRPR